jgi:hypothetical protein
MMQEEWGHSYSEVLKAFHEASRHRQNRSTTLALCELGDGPTVMVESLGRKMKRLLNGKNTKQEELNLWIKAHRLALENHETASTP